MSFSFATPRARRRPSLTPMIDVVFLLLVFFMLAARFGQEAEITLTPAIPGAQATAWQGPPRLLRIAPEDLTLNGTTMPVSALADALAELVQAPDDPVILMPVDGAALQRVLDVMAVLDRAGYANLILAEAP